MSNLDTATATINNLDTVNMNKVNMNKVNMNNSETATSKWPRTERFWNRIKSLKQRLLKGEVKAVAALPLKESPEVGDEETLIEVDSDPSLKKVDESPKEGNESPKKGDESPKKGDESPESNGGW
jgi:hypothetical protein